jgi:hypothetical protein
MAHRPTMPVPPVLPGWEPLVEPPRHLQAGAVLRWWWPAAVATGFLVLVAIVGDRDDPAPGLSTRGLATLTLATVALATLTIRRQSGPWALARALAEYTVIVLLVGLLTTPPTAVLHAERAPATAPRPPVATQEAASLPPGMSQLVSAGRWLVELWDRAEAMTDDPPPTRPQPKSRALSAPLPHRPGGPPS